MATQVGFIGLGVMGLGMAKNLVRKGLHLIVYDVREQPIREVEQFGAYRANSPKEVAAASDVLFSMVRDDQQTEEVMWGPNGVLAGLRTGAAIVVTSSISPSLCKRLAVDAAQKGAGVLDAPVSMGPDGPAAMEAGTITIMVGGDKGTFDRARPILELAGKNVFYLGEIGMGEAAKLANNAIVCTLVVATSEALAYAVKAGIPLQTALEIFKVSSGNNYIVQNWDYFASLKQDRSPSATYHMATKDVGLFLANARQLGLEMPLLSAVRDMDFWRKVEE